jgi:hypothetical protein
MVSNASGGKISGGNTGIWLTDNGGTVDNAGTITGGSYSVNLAGLDDTLILEAGGVLNGAVGGFRAGDTLDFASLSYAAGDTVTVDGSGLLTIRDSSDTVLKTLQLAGNFKYDVLSVSADAGGTGTKVTDTRLLISEITGASTGVVLAAGSYTNPVTVTSTGSINASGDGVSAGTNWTVQNSGKIHGDNNGVYLQAGGTLTNEGGGTITGSNAGVYTGFGAAATVDNSGSIGGTDGYGVSLRDGGEVSNASGGTITGGRYGVYMNGAGAVQNFGSICSQNNYGVDLRGGGTVFNASGAHIAGGNVGVYVNDGGTVENAGTISGLGRDAVYLAGGGSRLILDAGALFQGQVQAQTGGAANTIELTSSTGAGTLTGLTTEYMGFGTITIDPGANWTIKSAAGDFNGITLGGFNAHDTVDLTNVAYATGDTASLNGMTDILTLYDSGHDSLATLQLSGGFTGEDFHLAGDGGSGTNITLSDSAACYFRGTRVLTERGEVPVEDLAIGDRLVTLSGEAKPIKWIGRRAYAGWIAAQNAEVQPVLLRAGSLGDFIPARDLMVSPEHAMYLDGALIPARLLVNGRTIVQTTGLKEIAYFHLELDRHDVIFAEGAASETYLDERNRGMFHNAAEFHTLYPDARPGRFPEYCAPRIENAAELRDILVALESRAGWLAAGSNRKVA